jgi:hypothetical protein
LLLWTKHTSANTLAAYWWAPVLSGIACEM